MEGRNENLQRELLKIRSENQKLRTREAQLLGQLRAESGDVNCLMKICSLAFLQNVFQLSRKCLLGVERYFHPLGNVLDTF